MQRNVARVLAYDPAEELLADLDADESARLSPALVEQWIEDAKQSAVVEDDADEPPPASCIRSVAVAPVSRRLVRTWLLAVFVVTLVLAAALVTFVLP